MPKTNVYLTLRAKAFLSPPEPAREEVASKQNVKPPVMPVSVRDLTTCGHVSIITTSNSEPNGPIVKILELASIT
jgi:hypothetical protein